MATTAPQDLDRMLKAMTVKDLRVQLRARGLTPAGGQEALTDRLKSNMFETKDFALKSENGADTVTIHVTAGVTSSEQAAGNSQNNYSRPAGQNVGNFMTDRNSSRVLAPPGGGSQITFGDDNLPAPKASVSSAAMPSGDLISGTATAGSNNNYSRPAGQNVGNFLTDRNSSRVLAPPGGGSQIVFGDDNTPAPKAPISNSTKQEAGDFVSGNASSGSNNNYSRPAGQNVGNFLTDRNSSRVLAPPGGCSQIVFGDDNVPAFKAPAGSASTQAGDLISGNASAGINNNYSRPAGQNVGNFMTDRNSSRVLAPPGGTSQITFG